MPFDKAMTSLCSTFVIILATMLDFRHALPNTDTQEMNVQKFITRQVNRYRRSVDAADMLEISWDFEARVLAQKLTDRCDFRPPRNDAEKAMFLKTKKYTCSLNMARGTGELGWNETLKMWFDEKRDFQYGIDTRRPVSQYTALIRSKTYRFGCGYTQCRKGSPLAFDFFACTFCPGRNVGADEFRPYEQGQRCGRCPNACSDGLCTNPCLEANVFANCDTELFPDGCDGIPNSSPLAPFREQCQATCQCRRQGLMY
ncbi:putative Cysteine-rich secretory protein 3 [Hypsibius exemplaris]|uniref:Cysteine-rich secretory protein 3 n=1 Tax=Hypsibius exemplaris TaxID=2072580 RepID=A0A1W0WNT6_HYPEX|nr:putative Cysteine-rich secretory protein 3 [Hypsibius exemplaris]